MCSLQLPFNQDFLQTSIDEVGHEGSIVAPHSFNAFAIHFVVAIGTCEVQPRIPLLVDQQVWEVDLPDTKVRLILTGQRL